MSDKSNKATNPSPHGEKRRELLYTASRWKSVVNVYKCAKCTFSTTDEDDMKLHVTNHVPAELRNQVLDKLVAVKPDGDSNG
jgi:hypothetical protein